MTNNRFLLLRGSEFIGYAREFPNNIQLPFQSMQQVPQPKVIKPIAEVEKVNVKDILLLIDFIGQKKTHWEF